MHDAGTGKELRTISAHSSRVTGVAFVGSKSFVSSSNDDTLKAWDLATGRMLFTIKNHGFEYVEFECLVFT